METNEQSRERQRPDRQPDPRTWLLTFTCYGTWLHGHPNTVDRNHNIPGNRRLPPNTVRLAENQRRMHQPPYSLDDTRRPLVLSAIRETCHLRNWELLAVHVRTNHVHVVLQSQDTPEHMIATLKAYASRALNGTALDGSDRRRWTRHGSTVPLTNNLAVSAAVNYVICRQGDPMAAYAREEQAWLTA